MKFRPLLFSFALVTAPTAIAQITDSLQAYWDFEGSSENNAAAQGGTAFNGTLVGGATTTGAAVKVGSGSLNLDGINDYMSVGTNVDVNQAWTVSSWFRPDISPAGAARMMVYESRGSYAMSYGLREGTAAADTNFQLFNQRTGGDLQGNLQVPDTATANTWHHIITSFTPSTPTTAGSLRGYLNGVLQYNITVPVNSTHGTSAGFNVGTYRNADGRWFDGAIDEVAIWNSSLGAADAYWVYNLGDRGFALSTPERAKADNLMALNAGASWAGGIAPGAAESITFSSAFTQASALGTGGDLAVAGLRVIGGSGLIQIDNSGGFLETGALGIDMSGGGRDLTVENLRISASQRWNIGTGATFTAGSSSLLTGAHGIEKTGSGTAILLGDASATGGTVIRAGTLQVGGGGATGTLGSGAVTNNASLAFNRDNAYEVGNTISGTGSITVTGGGIATFTGDSNFSGGTTVTGGTLRVGSDTAFGTGMLAMNNGTRLSSDGATGRTLANHLALSGDVFLGSTNQSGMLTFDGSVDLTNNLRRLTIDSDVAISGVISNGSFRKDGAGVLTLSGDNTFGGRIFIDHGVLAFADVSALGQGTGNDGRINFTGNGVLRYTGVGSQQIANRNVFSDLAGSSATIDVRSATGHLTVTPAAGTRNRPFTKEGDGMLTMNGAFSGGATVTVNGGILELAATNTYNGTTTVSAGTLLVTGALGATAVTVQDGGTIGGAGSLGGALTFDPGAKLDLTGAVVGLASTGILNVSALHSITLTDFAFGNISGWDWSTAEPGTYTLINGGIGVTLAGTTPTAENPSDFGDGRFGYFQQGSLQAVIIPEPASAMLGGLGVLLLLRRRRA